MESFSGINKGSSFFDLADRYSKNAIGARSILRPGSKTKQKGAGHTAGGAISAGLGGALMGAQSASMFGGTAATAETAAISATGKAIGGAALGAAGLMAAAYYLS